MGYVIGVIVKPFVIVVNRGMQLGATPTVPADAWTMGVLAPAGDGEGSRCAGVALRDPRGRTHANVSSLEAHSGSPPQRHWAPWLCPSSPTLHPICTPSHGSGQAEITGGLTLLLVTLGSLPFVT